MHRAPGDADLLIVRKAVESACHIHNVLVGDDTDLLVLLCYHASLDSTTYFYFWNMHQGCQGASIIIGPEVCTHILFLHAVLATSRLYGIGKEISLKKFKSSEHFREQAKVFSAQSASFLSRARLLLQGNKY